MVGVEDNLVFVVVSVCPSVVCEEVLYVCGRILEGRVGKIEGGRHGVRGVLACLVWCSCVVFLCGSSLASNLFCCQRIFACFFFE